MVFGIALLLSAVPQAFVAVSPSFHSSSATVVRSAEISAAAAPKQPKSAPSESLEAPEAKDARSDPPNFAYLPGDFEGPASAKPSSSEPIGPRSKPLPLPEAPKAAFRGALETPRERHVWYALAFTSHTAAAFDAWSTRRAITSGAGTEANPLLRPFSHSSALYAAIQVSPAVMDYFGRRMMHSPHPWVRKMWWLPQSAGTAMSIAAGVHNVRIVR